MRELILTVDENRYSLFLQFLQTLDYVKIRTPKKSVVKKEKPQNGYDFSDLIGKLQWQGDAVVVQRRLRDEW